MKAKKGDKVQMDYEGMLEDGTEFDSSKKHGQPLEFEVGSGMVIPGFDQAVEGMEEGEEKEVVIAPENAYGLVREELKKEFPKEQFGEQTPKVGQVVGLTAPTGQQFPATVKEVKEDIVILDLNHPLAGKTLKFKIKLVKIVQ
jgi:FKBP-type peptidyl-prolyl cis-trans isomerase 2